jgi:hypothetical protein
MRPIIHTASASGADTTLLVDYADTYFAIGFGCVISAGASLTYKVQHTFDDPNTVASPTWFDHPYVTGQTANKDGNYAFPIRAMRLNVTAYTSGSVTLTALMGGMG